MAQVPVRKLWHLIVFRMMRTEDIGLGATVKLIAAKIGGEQFKKWSARIGIPCGCSDREDEWNRLYPNINYQPNAKDIQ
jgi:hypothetical protein